MRVPRAVVLALAAWLSVVLVGSTMVWAVISRAGEQVVVGADFATSAASPSLRVGQPGRDLTHRPPGRAHESERPGPGGHSSAAPTQGPGTASATPGVPGSSSPTSAPTTPPAPPAVKRGTWSGVGGTVSVACQGSAISLVAATPDSGFSVEVEKGTSSLEVHFEGQGEDDRETQVQARCVSGAPRFSVESHDGGGDDESDDG